MLHKLCFTRHKYGVTSHKGIGLPSAQWMLDNIGEEYIDWKCYAHYYDDEIIVEFKDEDKMILLILKNGELVA